MPAPTKLEAVQQIVRLSGDGTPSALSTGNDNPAGRAERILDDAVSRYLSSGQAENVSKAIVLTAASSQIALDANVLRIMGTGFSEGRQFTVRDASGTPVVFDLQRDSSTFTDGDTVQLDIIRSLTWDDIAGPSKQVIIQDAAREYQAVYRGDPNEDRRIAERVVNAEAAQVASGNPGEGSPAIASRASLSQGGSPQ